MDITPIKPQAFGKTSVTPNTETHSRVGNQSMSGSLREKLKRSRPSFKSPFSVVKRLRIDDDTELKSSHLGIINQDLNGGGEHESGVNQSDEADQRDCSIAFECEQKDSVQQCQALKKALKERSETLRRLKMVKMYRKKNDLTQLQRLIDKWRACAQSALHELKRELGSEGKQASLSQIMDSFGIDDKLMHFDRKEEDFTNP